MQPFYFLSNDEIAYEGDISDDSSVFIGVANYGWLQALHEAASSGNKFIKLYAFDFSGLQIDHLKTVIGIIKASNSRDEFVSKLFKCGFSNGKINLDPVSFPKEYGMDAKQHGDYMELIFDGDVIGDFNSYLIHHSSTVSPIPGKNSFSAGYGKYFLQDDNSFLSMKALLNVSNIEFIQSPIEECLKSIMMDNRYIHNVLWVSNIFSEYFMNKNPHLRNLLVDISQYGVNREPNFPEMKITMIRDQRQKIALRDGAFGNRERPWSIHTESFHKVAKYVVGKKNVEVVDVQRWIDAQNGISKLPHAVMKTSSQFATFTERYDTVIFHILVGHGMSEDKMKSLKDVALSRCSRLIILEHNYDQIIDGNNLGIRKNAFNDYKYYDSACNGRNHIMVWDNN